MGWWSVSEWECEPVVCCPHCGEPLGVPVHDAEAQRFLDEVERMKDVPAPPVPTPDLAEARRIAVETWGMSRNGKRDISTWGAGH